VVHDALCFLPFLTANAIVAKGIEPFYSLIRPGPNTSAFELVLLTVVLAFIPVGAFIAARPLFDRSAPPGPRTYLLNGTVALGLLAVLVIVSAALGGEIYRCDVLEIPSCD
jgi:hypothetical protein